MDCDRYEVLYRIVRITNSTALEFPQICKDILRFLARRFDLESLSLLLLDSRHKTFSRVIHQSGPELFLPCSRPPEPGPELQALARRRLLPRDDDGWVLPLLHDRRPLGILILRTARGRSLAPADLEVFRATGEEISRLAWLEQLRRQEKQQLLQLALLAEFGRALNQVRSLDDLNTVCRLLLRDGQATGVVLRPLFDEAADNRPLICCQPTESGFAEALVKAESKYFAAATAAGVPVYRRPSRTGRPPAGVLPPAMAIIPLLVQGQPLGVLTLFGREDGLYFTGGRGGRRFLTALGAHLVEAIERLQSQKRLDRLALENDRKLQEASLLYRISRAIHSTLRLNELIHLLLSAAVAPGGGGFERAMLFTLNERTQTLQGMLCVTRETSALVLPPEEGARAWERPVVSEQARQRQREAEWCRRVMKQRLPLDPEDNALAMAISTEQVIFVPGPGQSPPGTMAAELQLGAFACAPLFGRHRPLGVLLVDNPASGEPFSPHRQRFLELFAAQAGSAMENSMLLHRLETAHEDLRETQERLIQGEKMAVLGEMAASLAHELRNPLVPLGGFAERLRRMFPAGSREGEYAEIISREARRMEEMLSNILGFSKKQMLCFTECRITEVIAEALDLERDALDRSSIEVITEIATDLPCVQCDDKKLRQVLINLVTNARQAMPDGGTLTVRGYRSILRGEEAVAVEIEDSGGGISPEVLHNIFNPFFTTKEKGTGLGLSISHRIIEHHRGEIEVKNHARGVVFTVRLPSHSAEVSRIDKPARFR